MAVKPPTPTIEAWYKTETGEMFEVVAVNDDDAIDIQYLDGTVEELDYDAWLTLLPREINPPRGALVRSYDDDSSENHYDLDDEDTDPASDWPDEYVEYED